MEFSLHSENFVSKYSRIRLNHSPPDRTKVADISDWMIKPVGPILEMPTVLCKTTKSEDVELLCCTAFTCATFQELELVQDHNFFSPCQTCPFRWSHLARMKHNHSCLQTGVAVAARESVSQAATPAIRAICAVLRAQMFPLAPLKVADIAGGLDDISKGFYYVLGSGRKWPIKAAG